LLRRLPGDDSVGFDYMWVVRIWEDVKRRVDDRRCDFVH